MRIIADRTLGNLARKLRILGYDTLYWRGGSVAGAVEAARSERRVLLTRSRKLQGKPEDLEAVVVEADDPREQLREVVEKLHLKVEDARFFRRCLLCNEELLPMGKEEAEGRVPDFILQSYTVFHGCPQCRRIYWPGTHYARMRKEMAGFIDK
jgi:uncharacterized protein with PIN domain